MNDNMNQYLELREKHKEFIYDGYKIIEENDYIKIQYKFIQPNVCQFTPTWTIPFSYKEYENKDSDYRNTVGFLIFNLGMVELISYWKACCSPTVKIKSGYLDENQIKWWKKLYYYGLGEFFYTNGIEAELHNFMELEVNEEYKNSPSIVKNQELKGNLVPIGGGKDSIVTLELLNQYKDKNKCYIINPRGATIETAQIAGYSQDSVVKAYRTIDKNLIALNSRGYLNGHTPFSAIVAFSTHLCAFFDNKKYIVLSNESSANEAYVKDTTINHQYSKSVEFENDFREYVQKYLNTGSEYFSLLRVWNEWRIVEQFVKYEKYFQVFKSCNAGSKENIWCGKCSKCLYVYIMLSAFLPSEKVEEIFGKNLFEDEEMLQYFHGLVCEQYDKPFECVGTRDEINAAFCKTIDQYEDKNNMPIILKTYYEHYYKKADYNLVYHFYDHDHNLTDEFKKLMN